MAVASPPYHSILPQDPDVHHVFSDCPYGQQIEPENKRWGTNGWPLCGQLSSDAVVARRTRAVPG